MRVPVSARGVAVFAVGVLVGWGSGSAPAARDAAPAAAAPRSPPGGSASPRQDPPPAGPVAAEAAPAAAAAHDPDAAPNPPITPVWDDDAPEALRPEAAAAIAEDLARRCGITGVRTDCAEPPCLFAWREERGRWCLGRPDGAASAVFELAATPCGPVRAQGFSWTELDETWGPDLRTRVGERADALAERVCAAP